MGEWMQRAALIQSDSTTAKAEKSESALLQPNNAASTAPKPGYQRYPDCYEVPRFVIPTADCPVEFQLAVPKENYDAFAILDLFIKHHGPQIAAPRD